MKQPYTTPPILDHAVAVAGGKSRLAEEMDVTPAAVTHWYTRGLPMHVAVQLMRKYGRRKSPQNWKPKQPKEQQ